MKKFITGLALGVAALAMTTAAHAGATLEPRHGEKGDGHRDQQRLAAAELSGRQ